MLNHLLGLDHLNLFADGTYLSFRYALPAWAWLLIVLGAGGFSAWTYSRLLGAKWARTLLAGVRTLALLLVAVLLAGPQLQQDHEVVEPDCVLVLVDRSASMMVRDVRQAGGGGSADEGGPSSAASDAAMGAGFETSGGSGGGVTRDAAVRAALAELEKQPDNPLRSSDDRQVLWFGFDAQAYALSENSGGTSGGASGGGNPRMSEDAHPRRGENTATSGQQLPGVPGLPELPGAEGQATLLRSALDEALYRVGGRPVSGVVLITDGRSPQATGPEYEAMLEQRRVAVFATPVGSEKLPADLLVENVDAPRRAFVKDRVPVQVKAAARGDVSPDQPVTVRLIEGAEGEGKTVDVYHTTAGELGKKPITLTAVREQPGDATWRVEVSMAPGSGDGTASGGGGSADEGGPSSAALSGASGGAFGGELVTANNFKRVDVKLVDRALRVLYVEGYPRWEYRYLVSMLKREKSIESSVLLLSAERGFAQEGDLPITRFPRDMKELGPYDVIIIGDVPPRYFGDERPSLIREHVAQNGAGLLWIGGSQWTPAAYDATALADLLGMSQPASVMQADATREGFKMAPTLQAERLGVMVLSDPLAPEPTDAQEQELWDKLPALAWMQQLGRLKPAAQVLATAQAPGESLPAVVHMHYGAGQTLYVATDDTWRWRYGRGELFFEQFWIELVRMLGRQRLDVAAQRPTLSVEPERLDVGDPAVVRLRMLDASQINSDQRRVNVAIRKGEADDAGATVGNLVLQRVTSSAPGSASAETSGGSEASGGSGGGVTFEAVWRPGDAGAYVLKVVEPTLEELVLPQRVEVVAADDELRQPEADHARLRELSATTGGAVVPLNELGRLGELLPNRRRVSINSVIEPLWHAPLILAVFVTLVGVEWIGRKLMRLA